MSKAELSARLAAGEGRVATCWRLERRDGVVLGFTDHDRDLTFDGVVFRASSGLRSFALERSTGGSTDTSQAAGALSASAITEADILAGKYRGAEIVQWLVDWSDPEVRFIQMRAHVGEVRQGNGGFEAELLSLSDAFNTPVGRSYLKTCDVEFGSAKCRVDTDDPAWRTSGAVGGVEDRKSFLFDDAGGFAEGWFENGVLTWTSGANLGETMRDRGGWRCGPGAADRVAAGDAVSDRRGRRVRSGRWMRQAVRDLPGQVCKLRELSRVPAYSGSRLGDGLSPCGPGSGAEERWLSRY